MSGRKILLQLLPVFIPLFAFILAYKIWGIRIGLFVAIGVGIGGLIWYWVKDRRFDRFILFEFARSYIMRRKLAQEEWLPLLNSKGEIIGKAPRSVCHSDKSLLHPVVHLHVLNNNGEIYLQKRPMNKLVQPGKWDTAVGGHISYGEDVETSLKREAEEEIGIKDFKAKLVSRYIWESDREREYVFCFVTRYNGQILMNSTELADGRFWSRPEIQNNLGKDVFTPNFEEEFRNVLRGE